MDATQEWPSWEKMNNVRADFLPKHIPATVERVLADVKKCSEFAPTTWEVIFVGTGKFVLPELTLLSALQKNRIRISAVRFVDVMYDAETATSVESILREGMQYATRGTNMNFSLTVSQTFSAAAEWTTNGRIVLAFSRLVHWANSSANIAFFLRKNWSYVMAHCQTSHVAFLDYFFHLDPTTDDLIISDFSDVTQPPLRREIYRFGTWESLWTDYVRFMIHPELRKGVVPMLPWEKYEHYCAKYGIMTPNDARNTAMDLCKLCGRRSRSQTLKRKR